MRTRYSAGVCMYFLRGCRKSSNFRISKKGGSIFSDAPALSLSKNLCRDESAQVLAGELEGAAARLEWDQMPPSLCVIPAPTCPEAAVLPRPSKKHSPASPRAPRRRRHCNYNSDNNIYSDYYSNSYCNCNCYCYCNAALFARKRTTSAPVSPMVGGRISQPVPKHSRTAQAAARKPVRSAHRAAGMAYRVRETPTDPK